MSSPPLPCDGTMKLSALKTLYDTLQDEKHVLVRQAVSNSKFHRLSKEDKLHVNVMYDELKHYEQYLKDIREARALNSYVRLVTDYMHRGFRELRNSLVDFRRSMNSLIVQDALHELKGIVLMHEKLMSHVQSQRYRGWHIGCAYRVPRSQYKRVFQYTFPKCAFSCPLIIRNNNMWVENIVKMTYAMLDLPSKLIGTHVHTIDRSSAQWLGRRVYSDIDCAVRVVNHQYIWLTVNSKRRADASDDRCETVDAAAEREEQGDCVHTIEFNGLWLPAFSVYVKTVENQVMTHGDIYIRWDQTTMSADQVGAVLHYFEHHPCESGSMRAELYCAAHVDWSLFTPFVIKWDTVDRPSNHAETLRVQSVVDGVDRFCGEDGALSPGYTGLIHTLHAPLLNKAWPHIIDRAIKFYETLLVRIENNIRTNEDELRQIEQWKECLHNTMCTQKEIVVEYLKSNRALVHTKIHKVNSLMKTVESMFSNGYE